MDDPNRSRQTGDPNTDASRPESDWNTNAGAGEATEPADPATTTWTGSNPGLTGDVSADTGTLAEPGSGASDAANENR